jgi:hypothetical protein
MKITIATEAKRARKKPLNISDQLGRKLFAESLWKITDSKTAEDEYHDADAMRLGDRKSMHHAAYKYLAIGVQLLFHSDIEIKDDSQPLSLTAMFHFAGNTFREIGQVNRAADAYWRAGALGVAEDQLPRETVRSLARAKACFAEIGEIGESENMHKLEWEARRKRATNKKRLLWLWKITSDYGTSLKRWFFCLVLFILTFWAAYEVLHIYHYISEQQPWYWSTGLYYFVVTVSTLGYGDFVPKHWLSQLVVIANIVFGYIMLGYGLTVLGAKILRR